MQCHVIMFITSEQAFFPFESLSGDSKGWKGGFAFIYPVLRKHANTRITIRIVLVGKNLAANRRRVEGNNAYWAHCTVV